MRAVAVSLLLVAWCATPAMACLLPAQALTPAESACCKQMAGQCHQSNMKHSCCTQVRPEDPAAFEAAHQQAPLPSALAVPPAVAALPMQYAGFVPVAFESPPHSPPAAKSILRI